MANTGREQEPETRAITAGRDESGALAPALWASSTWDTTDLDGTHAGATTVHGTGFYSRYANPTVQSFEQAIAKLEGTEAALAFGSGMGAITATIFALCSTGDHIVAQRNCYAGTLGFLVGPCKRMGIDVTYVDGRNAGEFAAAVRPGKTILVIAETPSNPHLDIVDLDALGAIKGPFTMVDSTMATPLAQQPCQHGVSITMHSATKGIAGHNDATLGVIAAEKELIDTIWGYSVLHGATASPFDALNGLRGVRTLGVRLRQQSETAQQLAEWLSTHPAIKRVNYPGLPTHPQHALAKRQMRLFGSIMSIELCGDINDVRQLTQRLQLVRNAVTLGGPDTLISHSATSTHLSVDPAVKAATGISDSLLRVSVGLEAFEDL
ncbi:MAG: PLP-dependent aspartate aminotransferase family protein, partial [Actinomycetota bacterium]|nr:PLP-dependent aspartate aminotransferase family protein [Actinomycetota bacterium]